jgi:hypothetical protein
MSEAVDNRQRRGMGGRQQTLQHPLFVFFPSPAKWLLHKYRLAFFEKWFYLFAFSYFLIQSTKILFFCALLLNAMFV